MKKRGKQINLKINLTNRWLYTLIALGILAAVGIGVYALTPGVSPNPGHLLNDISPPSPCSNGQYLRFDGTNLICATIPVTDFSNINSYFVINSTSNFGGNNVGWFYVGPGGSKIFSVYKPIMVHFDAIGNLGTIVKLEMTDFKSSPVWGHIVSQLDPNAVDFNGGDYKMTALQLLPGKYRLTVSNTGNAGAWIFLQSVYGQNNNNPATVWNLS